VGHLDVVDLGIMLVHEGMELFDYVEGLLLVQVALRFLVIRVPELRQEAVAVLSVSFVVVVSFLLVAGVEDGQQQVEEEEQSQDEEEAEEDEVDP
jgi:hypothetical protein